MTALGSDVNMSIDDSRLLHLVMLRRHRQQAAAGYTERRERALGCVSLKSTSDGLGLLQPAGAHRAGVRMQWKA